MTMYNQSLVHCNDSISSYVTEEQIPSREAPDKIGPRHNPVPFNQFIEPIKHQLDMQGWAIEEEALVLSHKGDRLFGCYKVTDRWVSSRSDYHSSLFAFRAAHDQAWGRSVAPGTVIYICDNTVISSDMNILRTKQTTFLMDRMYDMIKAGVVQLRDHATKTNIRFDFLASADTPDEEAHDIIAKTYRKGGVDAQGMAKAINEYHTPILIPDDSPEPSRIETAWGVFNALTSAAKTDNEFTFRNRTAIIEDVIYSHYGI